MNDPNCAEQKKILLDSIIAEGLKIQSRFRPEPLYKTTGKGSYKSNVVAEVASAKNKPTGR